MKVALLTREFPPEVYGGAGVHVEYLSRELARLVEIGVFCFGQPRQSKLVAASYLPWDEISGERHGSALRTMSVGLRMAGDVEGVDLVHSHTWYANFGGHLAKLLYDIPHVVTTHSLEPLRPWKADQLGAGYALSMFCEQTAIGAADAVIAVSESTRRDVLQAYPTVAPERVHVIHNGIDPDEYQPDPRTDVLEGFGIDAGRPYVMFVGRITPQKGLVHLLDAASWLDPQVQLVLCAGAPDTPEFGAQIRARVTELQARRDGVFWIQQMLPRPQVVQLLSHATVFVCPSVYEPFGLINVEAMACELPVVASATGGIPEIVVDGETGCLVAFEAGGDAFGSPRDPIRFGQDLAASINDLVGDRATARRFGQAGRRRVLEHFSWSTIAGETVRLYRELVR
jgi:alpha-maltose-1-phosphate synthase